MERIVLAHSGSDRTVAAIERLAKAYRAEVVTLTLDLGQGRPLEGVHGGALAAGALRAHVIDAREIFAREFILPALRADALAGGRSPLVRALGRAVVAKHLADIAKIEDASIVAHGDVRTGVEPSFATMLGSLAPDLEVIAACQGEGPPSFMDANLWGRVIDSPAINDPGQEPPEDLYLLTKSPDDTPDLAAYVEFSIERGVPVAINGVEMPLVELIQSLETIAGAHGVGRVDTVEHDSSGRTARVVYEAPAAMALHAAHAELQRLVVSRDVERLTLDVAAKYADLASTGLWFTPARAALDALVNEVQQQVTGTVRLKLHKADCRVVGRAAHGGPEGPPHVPNVGRATPNVGRTFRSGKGSPA